MRGPGIGIVTLALAASVAAGTEVDYTIADSRSTAGLERHRVQRIVVLGISGDPAVRHPFENKLVSFLRGQEGVWAIASYRAVPDLTALPSREEIVRFIDEQQADSVITVRAVGLDSAGAAAWVEAWNAWTVKPSTVRELVEQSIPAPPGKAEHLGVEFALWDLRTPGRLWAGRTEVHERKGLRKGISELLLDTIQILKEARWL